nr:LIM domain-containing protein 2-like [Penaeus vannamei]
MERLEVAGRVLHKNCFKCCKCSTKLSMNSFSIGGEDIYCMTHYKQAFTEKGTYDVFTPNKGKWTRKIEATSSRIGKESRIEKRF